MNALFLQVLNLSLAAGWMVLGVLLLRVLLKKAPKWVMGVLWGLVGLRLVLPFSLESRWSLQPSVTVGAEKAFAPETVHTAGDMTGGFMAMPETSAAVPGVGAHMMPDLTSVGAVLWIVGVAVMLGYALFSYLHIRTKVQEAVCLRENIWLCDSIDTPFLLGIVKPRIYLPSSMSAEDIPYVIAHEQAHWKRKDHIWKPLGFLLLSVYWFHPLLWVVYWLMCKDIELACDEKVIRTMGEESKKPYSYALINCSVPKKVISACPLAFGEVGVKERVKGVLNYKKPAFWVVLIAVAACVIAAVCFLTKPVAVKLPEGMEPFLNEVILEQNRSEQSKHFECVDYQLLRVDENRETVTVYAWVLYEELSYDGAELHLESAAHTPTVITAQKKENQQYSLVEYWTPRDGSYYPKDIRAKFPLTLWGKAMDGDSYLAKQQEHCRTAAMAFYTGEEETHTSAEDMQNSDGSYWYVEYGLPGPTAALLLIPEEHRFQFAYSLLSSYIPTGIYEEQGDLLVMRTEYEPYDTYTFRKEEDTLVFLANQSAELPFEREGKPCVPDGAVFERHRTGLMPGESVADEAE